MKFRVTYPPFLNVRTGPGLEYADVGNLYPGAELDILNVGGSSAWVQIQGGEFDGKWACIQLGKTRHAEPVE